VFGFGKKKRNDFNGAVDTKLNNEYQIQTRSNELFPGSIAYLGFLDIAWKAKMNEHEASMYMAILYYCGLIDNGHYDVAEPVGQRIQAVSEFCLPKGMIGEAHWKRFNKAIHEAADKVPA
jgi:hypothetical protein